MSCDASLRVITRCSRDTRISTIEVRRLPLRGLSDRWIMSSLKPL
jgi:hypothetical protein